MRKRKMRKEEKDGKVKREEDMRKRRMEKEDRRKTCGRERCQMEERSKS